MTTDNKQVSLDEIQQVWKQADCLYDAQQLARVTDNLAAAIERKLGDKNPVVLTVMTGGMIFASHLLTRLAFPLLTDYLHATRYLHDNTGGELKWVVTPSVDLADRHVLIIDDILDVGETLSAIVRACESQGAASVTTAVLVEKQHNRKTEPAFKADFVGVTTDDRYLFGFGMDYKGYLRNANGIYAVRNN